MAAPRLAWLGSTWTHHLRETSDDAKSPLTTSKSDREIVLWTGMGRPSGHRHAALSRRGL